MAELFPKRANETRPTRRATGRAQRRRAPVRFALYVIDKGVPILFLVGSWCMHSLAVGEDENRCSRYPEVTQDAWPYYTDSRCDCGTNLSVRYEHKEPFGTKLIAVCDFRKSEHGDVYGGFFFRGKIVKAAPVTFVQGSLGGPRLHFEHLKFIDREAAFRTFGAPALTKSALCWRAEATVEITQLLVMRGPGTDEDGEWPVKYRVLNIGSYAACDAAGY